MENKYSLLYRKHFSKLFDEMGKEIDDVQEVIAILWLEVQNNYTKANAIQKQQQTALTTNDGFWGKL